MPAYLAEIVAAHRRRAADDRRDVDDLVRRAAASPAPAGFRSALEIAARSGEHGGGLAVVAEVKRRSPSKGELAPGLDAASVADDYAAGGATCVSVLTDADYFGGSPEDLVAAKRAVGIPVLRKDFTVSIADVCDARLMGADALLLIVAALGDDELSELLGMSRRVSLDALVEVHDEEELARALALGADLVGVNQRDLTTFEVDPHRAGRLVRRIPDEVVAVAESGIGGPEDARRLAAAGFDAVLVGEALVTAPDRRAAVGELTGYPVRPRTRDADGGVRHARTTGLTRARTGSP